MMGLEPATSVILLPGIIAPAEVRYRPLLAHLNDVRAIAKELEVYSETEPPAGYSIETEVEGISAEANRRGLERFHLYGHSGGGACALAFAASHPERLLSLTVDEPATDFSEEDRRDPFHDEVTAALSRSGPEGVAAFMRLQVAPGVDLPPPPEGPPPPWMANRPAGAAAFAAALGLHTLDPSRYEAFRSPVLYTHGSLSHRRWTDMRDRLARRFPNFTSELFEGLHHVNTSNQAEPHRTAELLRALWAQSEST